MYKCLKKAIDSGLINDHVSNCDMPHSSHLILSMDYNAHISM